jgi:hypothetical protein
VPIRLDRLCRGNMRKTSRMPKAAQKNSMERGLAKLAKQ